MSVELLSTDRRQVLLASGYWPILTWSKKELWVRKGTIEILTPTQARAEADLLLKQQSSHQPHQSIPDCPLWPEPWPLWQ
jgi:hypothetical protein